MEPLNAEPGRSVPRRAALKAAGLGFVGLAAGCTVGSKPRPESGSSALTGGAKPVSGLSALSAKLSRSLVQPGGAAFTSLARLYNPRFDSAPAPIAVAQCATPADVAACVSFAGSASVPISVRAGGHSYGGWSRGRGLMIDVRGLSSVQVDRTAGLARIGAGALLVDVYTALAAENVALAGGSCPSVGLTGLALGGGVGVLSRAYGLTCDAITSVQIVTADGRLRTADANQESDLFWAVRGGGGSFGAVTELTLAVQPAPTITTFFLQFDFNQAEQVLTAWQQWIVGTSASLWSTCKLLADPGNGTLNATVSGTWIGPPAELDVQLAPLLGQVPTPIAKNANTAGYGPTMLGEAGCSGQSASACLTAALQAPKRQPFAATSAILEQTLPAAGVAAAVATARSALSVPGLVEGGVSFDSLGGAVATVDASATPFPYRRAVASVQYTATWGASAAAGLSAVVPFDGYVRGFRAALAPWLGTAAYVNYADASIANYGEAYWGANYARLRQVKAQYDPGDLFTFAQSVKA
ncbi:MAG: FAD-binding protein [Pseudonocardiales bacterium]|nr:FAD-binding protein [Pseudonocardiales bacterium]